MIEGNSLKLFVHYVSKSVLSMIGMSCYILADTFFVANGVGSMGVAALNITLPVFSVVNGIGLMLGMGAATRYSILKGEAKHKEASVCFTHALVISITVGIILTAIGALFAEDIAQFLGADAQVLPLAKSYLLTIMLFSCAFIVNQVFVCFVRNDSNPNLSMKAMLTSSFSNIVLDYLFIFPMGLGMFGAAFATGIAPILSMVVLSSHYIKKKNQFHIMASKPNAWLGFNIITLGLPSFITEASSGIIMAIFNFLILGIAGSIGVAAYGVIANLALVVVAIYTGIGQGIQPIVSLNAGTKNIDANKAILCYGIILSLLLGVAFYITGSMFAKQIVALFNKEQNQVLAELAQNGIPLYFLAFIIMGINIVSGAYLAAASKPVQSFIICIVRGCIAPVMLSLLLSHLLGMNGVWLTIPFTELTAVVLSAVFLFSDLFKKTSKSECNKI